MRFTVLFYVQKTIERKGPVKYEGISIKTSNYRLIESPDFYYSTFYELNNINKDNEALFADKVAFNHIKKIYKLYKKWFTKNKAKSLQTIRSESINPFSNSDYSWDYSK